MLPLDLVLVRHGQSDGNVAIQKARIGDDSDFSPDFLGKHTTHWRLTDRGRTQARLAGLWLKQNNLSRFNCYYVSEYRRAIETAALLGLRGAKWRVDAQLRERDHGLLDIFPPKERAGKFSEYFRLMKTHRFYSATPAGESIADVCNRLRSNIIGALRQSSEDQRVIVVAHGEVLQAFRIIFEHLLADEFHQISIIEPRSFKIGNGQVIHYSRVNPANAKDVQTSFSWVRSVNPFDSSYAGHDWRAIKHRRFSNKELLTLIKKK